MAEHEKHHEVRLDTNARLENLPPNLERIEMKDTALIIETHLGKDLSKVLQDLCDKYGMSEVLLELAAIERD